MPRTRKTSTERFWDRVEKTDTCWLWTGSKTQGGYGQLSVDGVCVGAHRIAYRLLIGPYPAGYHIDHLCRVRNCVNPDHLEAVTVAENLRRSMPYRSPKRKAVA